MGRMRLVKAKGFWRSVLLNVMIRSPGYIVWNTVQGGWTYEIFGFGYSEWDEY